MNESTTSSPPGVLELPQAGAARVAIYTLVGGLMLLLAWAAFAQIDQVTRAPAQLIPAARTQLLQAPDGGVITQLHVREGQAVKTGELLVTLQKERAQAAVDDSRAKVAALRIALVRLQAEVYGKERLHFDEDLLGWTEYIRNQTELFNKRRTALREEINALKHTLSLARSELAINEKLVATGDVSRAEILRLQRSVADLSAQITNRENKYFQDAQAEMTKATEELNTQTEQLRDRSQLLEHTELLAPADGIVNNIRATTPGAVLRPGDTVLELLPTSTELIVEAKVSPADIAFVQEGQTASIKLDAYDSSIFGGLAGEVTYVSPDVLTEETAQGRHHHYRVLIAIRKPDLEGHAGQRITPRAGLSATVEIKAMERTVLSYLTKPITKTLSQSLGER